MFFSFLFDVLWIFIILTSSLEPVLYSPLGEMEHTIFGFCNFYEECQGLYIIKVCMIMIFSQCWLDTKRGEIHVHELLLHVAAL